MAIAVLLGAWLLAAAPAQVPADAVPLDVRLDAPAQRFIRPDDAVRIRLSRPLSAGEGRLAIVIADVDWSGLFALDGQLFAYGGGTARLPQGESTVAVYLVTPPNAWRQIGTFTLRVTTPAGFERVKLTPSADVSDQGQNAERHDPDAAAPPRATFQDMTSHLGLSTEHVRNGMTVKTDTNLLAVSNRTQALTFAQAGADAAKVDLSTYAWSIQAPHVKFAAGATTLNLDRHLAPAFPTRGMSLAFNYAPVDVTVALVNGQSVVGFENFFGVSAPLNRVALATVGAELVQRRPGAARIQLSFVGGSRQARPGVTQGQIADVLKSHGEALRFIRNDPASRLRVDGGFARSWSTNPADPLLSQGFTVVAVRPRTTDASYLDADYDVLRGRRIGRANPVDLTASYRLDRVEPFFSSVGAPQGIRSDVLQNTANVTATVGRITGQISESWSHDNLGRVASILRTDTGLTTVNVAVPTGALGQSAAAARWWPIVTYGLNRSGQTGVGLPQRGGFASASQVPDQRNTLQTLGADWPLRRWRIGYATNHSFQDNRQPGRETSDFSTTTQQITVGLTPVEGFNLAVTGGRDETTNVEVHAVSHTTHAGVTLNWRLNTANSVSAIANRTAIRDATSGPSDVTDVNLQYSYAFDFGAGGIARPRLQLFTRTAWQSSSALDVLRGLPAARRNWALTSGITIGLF